MKSASRKPQTSALLMALLTAVVFGCLPATASAQGNEWTWMGGPNYGAQASLWGTLGVPIPGNVPAARMQASTWTDSSGNFWLFGGGLGSLFGGGALLTLGSGEFVFNDIWKFNPVTNEWTWMGGGTTVDQPGKYGTLGIPAAGNLPGGRLGAASWTDSSGNFWLFGGNGIDANGTVGVLNDLWEFAPSNNQWAWMGGSNTLANSCFTYDIGEKNCAQPGVFGTLGTPAAGNVPGSRAGAATWTDNKGNLWLFGGWGFDVKNADQYYFNDLWEFNPSTKQWAWMGGTSTGAGSFCFYSPDLWYLSCGEAGVYGTLGTPTGTGAPGGRNGATSWSDNNGNLWLFGGQGFDSSGRFSDLSDMWEYAPSTNKWAWMGGQSTVYGYYSVETGVRGTLGTPAAGNFPPPRYDAASWKDNTGSLWLSGGEVTGWYGNSLFVMWSDLWQFNPSTNEWAWMGGDNSNFTQKGVFGTLGSPGLGNNPGVRSGMSSWTDSLGNLWLFGGQFFGEYITGDSVYANDFWKYQPSAAPLPTCPAPTLSVPGGTYVGTQTVTISDGANGATIYYTLDGTTPAPSTAAPSTSALYSGPMTFPYSITVKALAVAFGCFNSPVTTATYTLANQAPVPTFSPPGGNYLTPQTITVSDAVPGATIYYNRGGSSLIPGNSLYSTVYTSPLSTTGGEIVAAAQAPGYSNSNIVYAAYYIGLPAATPTFSVASGTYNTPQTVTISDTTPNASIYYTTDGSLPTPNQNLVYTTPIVVSSTETVTAIALANGSGSSPATATYTILQSPQTATPIFSMPSGTYSGPQTVTISDATPGASIFYTINGTPPTTSSSLYGGPVNVSSTETLEAIASATGYSTSAVASATYAVNLTAPEFSMASPASLSVAGGQSATATISVTPLNGFNSPVSFSCSGLPSGASCTFSPATVTPLGAVTSTTLTVTTSATTAELHRGPNLLFSGPALAIALCCFGLRKRRQVRLLVFASTMTCLSLLNGCASGSSLTTRQAVTSTVTVIATAGSLQHTATFSLTVN